MENLEIMNELRNTYSGKRIFVTGHTGFKGSWLIKILNELGARVKGFALVPDNEINLYTEINGNSLCESVISDLRDRDALNKAVFDFQPDFVFHLAAQPLVRLSYELPSETFEVNAIGTANLLDAIRLLDKRCNIVLITTDKVYQNNEIDYAYKETDKLGGFDPYSASKACCELVIDSYKNSFFNSNTFSKHQKALAVGRAGNVIGGGDWSKDRLIPDIAKSLSKGHEVVIRNPNAVRPWQHVIEPLFGYLELGVKLNFDPIKYAQPFNFGPNSSDALSVEDMVIQSIKNWGSGSYKSVFDSSNPHEAGLLKLDIRKVINELNWKPVFNAQIAVERTINWYKSYYNGISASELMEKDIDYYKNKING